MKLFSAIINGSLLAVFLFGMISCLCSCAVGPDGKKHYIGPKIRGAITYRGVGLELTLFDPLNPEDTRVIDVTPKPQGKEPTP